MWLNIKITEKKLFPSSVVLAADKLRTQVNTKSNRVWPLDGIRLFLDELF